MLLHFFHRINTSDTYPFFKLAPNSDEDLDTGFPDVRWSQTYKQGFTPNDVLVNVYTAIAIDLPDFDSPYGR